MLRTGAGEPHPEGRSIALEQETRRIGLVEMDLPTLQARKQNLLRQIKIGFDRIAKGDPPTKADGGILAIPTGLPEYIPSEAWDQVRPGTIAVTGEVAGTNWKFHQAVKVENGLLSLDRPEIITYPEDDRKVTFDEFVTRLAEPLAAQYKAMLERPDIRDLNPNGAPPLIGAISLGFPHANTQSEDSPDVDAIFLFDDEGKGPKEWQITDWDPAVQLSLAQATREKLTSLGITNIESLAFINDTSAVSLDTGMSTLAIERPNFLFFPNGHVGGSGTNATLRGINTEIGHALWPGDPIIDRMKANGWTQNDNPELETETGQYLPLRLAAGVQLLSESGFRITTPHGYRERSTQEIVKDILEGTKRDPAYISNIADGNIYAEPELRGLAKRMLHRAGQVYGVLYAANAEAVLGERTPEPVPDAANVGGQTIEPVPAAMLTEGSVVLKGSNIEAWAVLTARDLGQPIEILPASGAKGVTYLAMSKPYLEDAA